MMSDYSTAKPIQIAVLFGGRSGEHAVSLLSAKFILAQLDQPKYQVTQVGITREGEWFTGQDVLSAMLVGETSSLHKVLVLPIPGARGLYTISKDDRLELLSSVDVVFPVLHGVA